MAYLLLPESRLVLLTAGGSHNASAIRDLMDQDLDWRRVSALAQMQKAWAIIWREITRLGTPNVPDDLEKQLSQLASVYEFGLAHLEHRLWDTLDTFENAGIEAMLLKGSALAYSAYPAFMERPMGDIDLLVRAECAEEAWRLAQTAGWRWEEEEHPWQRYEEHHHLPPLVDSSGAGACLEIHSAPLRPGNPFEFSADTLWRAAKTTPAGGRLVPVPAPSYLLLHTSTHFAWSNRLQVGAWRTFRDVWALLGVGIDWSAFVRLANHARASTCAYWTLRLARVLTNAPVPMDVISSLRPPLSDFEIKRIERHFSLSLLPPVQVCLSGHLVKAMWEWGIRPKACGHGSARPWRANSEGSPSSNGLTRHARNWRHWARYLRGLLLPVTTRP